MIHSTWKRPNRIEQHSLPPFTRLTTESRRRSERDTAIQNPNNNGVRDAIGSDKAPTNTSPQRGQSLVVRPREGGKSRAPKAPFGGRNHSEARSLAELPSLQELQRKTHPRLAIFNMRFLRHEFPERTPSRTHQIQEHHWISVATRVASTRWIGNIISISSLSLLKKKCFFLFSFADSVLMLEIGNCRCYFDINVMHFSFFIMQIGKKSR